MNNTDDQRAAFEAWVDARWSTDKFPDWSKEYKSAMTHVAWQAWQAAIEHERKNSAAAELLAALCEIVKRNEIQHWFNLDQAKAAIEHAKKTERPCGYCTPPTFKGWQNGKCPYCGKTKTPIES